MKCVVLILLWVSSFSVFASDPFCSIVLSKQMSETEKILLYRGISLGLQSGVVAYNNLFIEGPIGNVNDANIKKSLEVNNQLVLEVISKGAATPVNELSKRIEEWCKKNPNDDSLKIVAKILKQTSYEALEKKTTGKK